MYMTNSQVSEGTVCSKSLLIYDVKDDPCATLLLGDRKEYGMQSPITRGKPNTLYRLILGNPEEYKALKTELGGV